MENNFNNEVIINDDIEAMDSGRKLIHDACNAFQIASTIIVVASIGVGIAKYIMNKRKPAKKTEKVIGFVYTEDIDTTKEK